MPCSTQAAERLHKAWHVAVTFFPVMTSDVATRSSCRSPITLHAYAPQLPVIVLGAPVGTLIRQYSSPCLHCSLYMYVIVCGMNSQIKADLLEVVEVVKDC